VRENRKIAAMNLPGICDVTLAELMTKITSGFFSWTDAGCQCGHIASSKEEVRLCILQQETFTSG